MKYIPEVSNPNSTLSKETDSACYKTQTNRKWLTCTESTVKLWHILVHYQKWIIINTVSI